MTGLQSIARGSRFVRAASRAVDRLRTAEETSSVGRAVRTLRTSPATATTAGGADTRSAVRPGSSVRSVLRGSSTAGTIRRLGADLEAASQGSAVTRLVATAKESTRKAWLYRWLTSEPDPEVVVIDLRQTRSVGPPLAVLDRAVDAIVPGIEGATVVRTLEGVADAVRRRPIAIASALALGILAASLLASIAVGSPGRRLLAVRIVLAGVATLGLRSHATLADVRSTRTARLLVAVLEPPDPPDDHDATGATSDRAEHGQHSPSESSAEEPDERADGDQERGAR